jgi:hypothetical protein
MVHPATRLDLLEFQTPPPGAEVTRYSYYSRKLLAAAAQTGSLQFFSDQVGVAGATIRDTNMTKGSAIGNPRRFLAQFLNCHIYVAGSTGPSLVNASVDVVQLVNGTVTRIDLLDKEYLTVPTWKIPAGGGAFSSGVTGTAAGPVVGALTTLNGHPDMKNAYPVELNLEREASFSVTLLFPASITLSAVGGVYVEYMLTGLLLRPRQ